MTKTEFMQELERLLLDISIEERTEAIQYYEDYFEDAGVKMEQLIIVELGSPAKVAASIKVDLFSNSQEAQNRGYFTEHGYQDENQIDPKYELIDGKSIESETNNESEPADGSGKGVHEDVDRDYHYEFKDNSNQINVIDLDIFYGNVTIKKGDSLSIDAYNMNEELFSSELEDGVWKIRDNQDFRNKIRFFNFTFSMDSWKIRKSKHLPRIEITIPEGFITKNLEVNLGAGVINADTLITENAHLHVGAGTFKINRLEVQNESYVKVGAGELQVDHIVVNNVKMENGVGKIGATGVITGDSIIKSGIGKIALNLEGKENNYNYSVDCGFGTVIINDKKYTGVTSKTMVYENAKNRFSLDNGIGNITLRFSE